MSIIVNVSAIVVHEPCQDRKVAALSEFAMCADFFCPLFLEVLSWTFVLLKNIDMLCINRFACEVIVMGLFGKKRGDKRHDYTTAQTTEEAEAIAKARKFEEWLKLIKQKILETSNETLEENRERSHYLYWIKGGLEDFAKRNPSKTEDCSRLIFAADLLAAELWMERQYIISFNHEKRNGFFRY